MSFSWRRAVGLAFVLIATLSLIGCGGLLPRDSKLRGTQSLKQSVVDKLDGMGSSAGAGMVIRIFKKTSELEVWKQSKAGPYKLFKTYNVCEWSGELGPKVREGDRQAPEGFYTVNAGLMNPNSIAYLSFNTGYPNKFDRAWSRTGSDLMVHGDCSSRGCYALTNEDISEVYALARESLNGGNPSIQLQIYPFRMTPQNLAAYSTNANLPFWQNLKEGYDRFEIAKAPPSWDVCEKKYVFDLKSSDGAALDAMGACPARGSDPLLAQLTAKQQADKAIYSAEVAAIAAREAAEAEKIRLAAAAEAAAKERGTTIGGFFGGIFGGGNEQAEGAIDPTKKAPWPATPPANRS
ncbi:MAG: murein L,D-transpeptidase family protein [Devosia sp.]